jgi:hypothetical protein
VYHQELDLAGGDILPASPPPLINSFNRNTFITKKKRSPPPPTKGMFRFVKQGWLINVRLFYFFTLLFFMFEMFCRKRVNPNIPI